MCDRLDALAEHLRATGERPVERTASRWLGEAEAIAVDLAEHDLERTVQQERLRTIEHLLSNVDGTGDETADEHLEAAREIVVSIQE